MRILIASLLLAAACGPAPKPEGPLVKEGSAVADNCCCKSTPIASVDGNPLYEPNLNRMECSTKQGSCVDEVQCAGKAQEPSPSATTPVPTPVDPTSAPIQ
jgi:hypothetical protein